MGCSSWQLPRPEADLSQPRMSSDVGASRIWNRLLDAAFDNSDRRKHGMGIVGRKCIKLTKIPKTRGRRGGFQGGPGPPYFQSHEQKCDSTNALSRFSSVFLDSAPSVPYLTVSLYLCSSVSNARGKSRAREGCRVSSKSPLRVRDRDEGVAGRNRRE